MLDGSDLNQSVASNQILNPQLVSGQNRRGRPQSTHILKSAQDVRGRRKSRRTIIKSNFSNSVGHSMAEHEHAMKFGGQGEGKMAI